MDFIRKLELADAAIQSIARHDDAEAAVRLAALDKVSDIVERERVAIAHRVQRDIDAALTRQPAA